MSYFFFLSACLSCLLFFLSCHNAKYLQNKCNWWFLASILIHYRCIIILLYCYIIIFCIFLSSYCYIVILSFFCIFLSLSLFLCYIVYLFPKCQTFAEQDFLLEYWSLIYIIILSFFAQLRLYISIKLLIFSLWNSHILSQKSTELCRHFWLI